ncbi:penicillin-binding protein activator [Paraglaciecola sp. L3A3]|uniref:penicillin-binding protein activator n=1 Tax=Paraglaciecola sp. L3A3 TaxID=2686358 RepID=UPI001E33806F|nr:penicillin-binding protein activator [Paraglaciecola sp. L3A3]
MSIWVAFLVLTSCTNTPKPKTKVKTVVIPTQTTELIRDSQFYLAEARQVFKQNNDTQQRDELLIQAAHMLHLEQQHVKSINLLNILLPELSNEKLVSQAHLILAEAYFAISPENAQQSAQLLSKVEQQYVANSRMAILRSRLFSGKNEWLNAANEIVQTSLSDTEKSEQIWQAISHLTLADLEKARWKNDSLLPWLQLAIIVQKYALTPTKLSQEVVKWQKQNVGHVLQQNIPKNITQAIEIKPIISKRVAVLLPLTGRLSSQGTVIKDGFFAAYMEDIKNFTAAHKQIENSAQQIENASSSLEIHFFDSALKTPEELNQLVADYDVVVGPLLKEKIEVLSKILPKDKILLALNRIDTDTTNKSPSLLAVENPVELAEHYYFSLAPEDEAEQLAQHIHQRKLTKPIIFAANNNVTERMAQAFVQQWQAFPEVILPEVIIFKDNKDMRKQVAEMLDVDQSKARIKQIEYLSNVEVFGEERNRRDIDAIVIFANPEETELLNPIIEASLSSFAEISLSVFASSRSYSQSQTDGSLRDLRNLTFTDMPFLLPEHKWPKLKAQINQLWPQRKDSLLRLFAMGYDAYSFIPQLRQLAALPQLSSPGLTGEISITSGMIKRKLPLAQISRDRVIRLEMD